MRVVRVGRESSPDGPDRIRAFAEVSYGAGHPASETYWLDLPAGASAQGPDRGDPWLAMLLPLAVTLEEPIILESPVDARLKAGVDDVMRVWSAWYPRLSPIPLEVDTDEAEGPPGRSVAAFFSGGVDSSFTVTRPRDEGEPRVERLLAVLGFDLPVHADEVFERFRRRAAVTASELGVELDHIRTNFRETRSGAVPWGALAHGCALAGVALSLQGDFRRVLIAATGGYRDLHPWGSHPLTDPLFSTSATELVHDGASYRRVDKLRHVLSTPALSSLRVCWESGTDANCGACMKCQQTMIALEIFGALERAPTMPDKVDLRAVRRLECVHSWDFRELSDLRELARSEGRRDIGRALAMAMRRSRVRGVARRFLRGLTRSRGRS